jgi:hypothetical protein
MIKITDHDSLIATRRQPIRGSAAVFIEVKGQDNSVISRILKRWNYHKAPE